MFRRIIYWVIWMLNHLLGKDEKMSSKKKCLLCGAENEHDAEGCHLCGHTEFESIEEPEPESEGDYEGYPYKTCTRCRHSLPGMHEGELLLICPKCGNDIFMSPNPRFNTVVPDLVDDTVYDTDHPMYNDTDPPPSAHPDPTEGDSTEFEVEVEEDPVFCSYLKDNNEMCRAKKPSPCGRHDSDKQKGQEAGLKEVVVEAFNKIHEANYSVSDLGLPEDASAFDFLSAVFYYLDINEDRMEHSPYIGMPVTAENEHDHRKLECWNQSTYDHSYHCKFCPATSPTPPWM
jgi:predicted  nucleic acid-binding Zn-ribbon protein